MRASGSLRDLPNCAKSPSIDRISSSATAYPPASAVPAPAPTATGPPRGSIAEAVSHLLGVPPDPAGPPAAPPAPPLPAPPDPTPPDPAPPDPVPLPPPRLPPEPPVPPLPPPGPPAPPPLPPPRRPPQAPRLPLRVLPRRLRVLPYHLCHRQNLHCHYHCRRLVLACPTNYRHQPRRHRLVHPNRCLHRRARPFQFL